MTFKYFIKKKKGQTQMTACSEHDHFYVCMADTSFLCVDKVKMKQ